MTAALPAAPTLDLADLVESVASQPELFSVDADAAPLFSRDSLELLRAPAELSKRTDSDRYSGRTATKNQRRCLLIGALVLLGRSKNDIARTVRCDKRLVSRIVGALVAAGLLPPLQTRVRAMEGELREETLGRIAEMLENFNVDRDSAAMLRTLYTGAGVLADKQMLADGSGGVNVMVQIGVATGPDVGGWRAQVRAVQDAPESESGGVRCAATDYVDAEAVVTGDDANAPRSPGAAASVVEVPEGGRGGSVSGPGGEPDDGLGTGNKPNREPEPPPSPLDVSEPPPGP